MICNIERVESLTLVLSPGEIRIGSRNVFAYLDVHVLALGRILVSVDIPSHPRSLLLTEVGHTVVNFIL